MRWGVSFPPATARAGTAQAHRPYPNMERTWRRRARATALGRIPQDKYPIFASSVFIKTRTMPTKALLFTEVRQVARVFQVSMCAAAAVSICGCASNNYKLADSAGASLHKAAVEIQAESRAIDVTLVRLDDLVNKPGPDLKPQFGKFSASLDRLVAASKRAEKSAEVAHQKSAAYFQNWDKETTTIKFEAVRDQSVSRKTQVSDDFNTVNQRYRENQAVIEPLISYLQDIRTALSTDLTVGGINSVKGLAANAEQNARKVQTALAQLSDELSSSGARMSSIPRREEPAEGGVGDGKESDQQHAESSTLTQ